MNWILLFKDMDLWRILVNSVIHFRVTLNAVNFLASLGDATCRESPRH